MILLFVSSSSCILLTIFIGMGSGLELFVRVEGGGGTTGTEGGMKGPMGFGKLVMYALAMVSYLT